MAEFNLNNWIAEQQFALGNMSRTNEDGQDVFDEGVLRLQQSLQRMTLENNNLTFKSKELDLKSKESNLKSKELELKSKELELKRLEIESSSQQKIAELTEKERELKWKIIGTGVTVISVAGIAALANAYCTRLGASCEMAQGGFLSSPTLKNWLPKWKDVSAVLASSGTKMV